MVNGHLLDIGEHVAEARCHDHAAPKAHEAGEDHGQTGVAIALFLAQPAYQNTKQLTEELNVRVRLITFSDRDHGHNANDPGHEAQDEHRDDFGGKKHLFHDDGKCFDSFYKCILSACPPGTARTLLSILNSKNVHRRYHSESVVLVSNQWPGKVYFCT